MLFSGRAVIVMLVGVAMVAFGCEGKEPATNQTPPSQPPSSRVPAFASAPVLTQESNTIAEQVRALFTEKCIECHGSDLEKPKAGFKGVELVDDLLKNSKYIKRFDPANSLLYQYLAGAQTPQMPKGDDPLTTEQLALVRAWIGENPGSGAAPQVTSPTAPKFIARPMVDDEAVIKLIHADLLALPATDRGFYRYVTYANLWNERLPDGITEDEQANFQKDTDDLLASTRLGFAKMLNSLSWSPSIVMPKAIDKNLLVYRIDLRSILCVDHRHWSAAQWNMLCNLYPYGRKIGVKQEEEIVQWLETELLCVRADWFVSVTSRPPLYHTLLGLPGDDGKPGADYALEKILGVDVRKNILEGAHIARAGIRDQQSGVSQHNRLIERHQLDGGAYYWKSYDFGDSVGVGNLIEHPLGPATLEGLPVNQRPFAFEHAGGEIIFSLPNGLQGYMLVKSDGARLNDGPSNIVFDRDNSADVKSQITNGVSCIACHSGGINPKLDQIRDSARKILPRQLRDELEALFPAQEEMDRMQKADKARFMAATAKLGIVDGCDQTPCEVVRTVSLRFAEKVTLERAAGEFGVRVAEFREALGGRLKGLREQLESGDVSRKEFISRFRQIVADNADFGEMSSCGAAPNTASISPSTPLDKPREDSQRVTPGTSGQTAGTRTVPPLIQPAIAPATGADQDRKEPSALTSSAPGSSANTYTVQVGDTLISISRKFYGTDDEWKRILEANATTLKGDAKAIAPGMKFVIPASGTVSTKKSSEPASSASALPAYTYTVQAGDTLESIARAQMGDGEKWRLIAAANPALNPKAMKTGQKLQIPDNGTNSAKDSSAPAADTVPVTTEQIRAAARAVMKEGRWSEAVNGWATLIQFLPGDEEATRERTRAQSMLEGGTVSGSVSSDREVRRQQATTEFKSDMKRSQSLLAQKDYDQAKLAAVAARTRLDLARNVLNAAEFDQMSADAQKLVDQIGQESLKDRESPAASTSDVDRKFWKDGQLGTVQGVELKPRKPQFTMLQQVSSLPNCRPPVVSLTFDGTGKCVDVFFKRSSGDDEIDGVLKTSLFFWRASGKKIDDLKGSEKVRVTLQLLF